MHVLLGIGVVAVLVAYAFGEGIARIFVGSILALMAAGVLLVAYISLIDTQRQLDRKPAYVSMGSAR